jgi:hypothetical protein
MGSRVKATIGWMGISLIMIGAALTAFGGITGKDLNSAGVAAIFTTGLLLTLGGMFGILPSEVSFGKDAPSIKLLAAASSEVKKATQVAILSMSRSPETTTKIMRAESADQAKAVALELGQQIANSIPGTEELFNRTESRSRL